MGVREQVEGQLEAKLDAWEALRGGLDQSWKVLGKTVDSVLSNFRS
jgi:hypothetical protein